MPHTKHFNIIIPKPKGIGVNSRIPNLHKYLETNSRELYELHKKIPQNLSPFITNALIVRLSKLVIKYPDGKSRYLIPEEISLIIGLKSNDIRRIQRAYFIDYNVRHGKSLSILHKKIIDKKEHINWEELELPININNLPHPNLKQSPKKRQPHKTKSTITDPRQIFIDLVFKLTDGHKIRVTVKKVEIALKEEGIIFSKSMIKHYLIRRNLNETQVSKKRKQKFPELPFENGIDPKHLLLKEDINPNPLTKVSDINHDDTIAIAKKRIPLD